MARSVELSQFRKFKIRSFLNRELSCFDINESIHQHALMQAIASYERFTEGCLQIFGWGIFYLPVTVEILKSSVSKNSKNRSMTYDCISMMQAITTARKVLKRSSSDRLNIWVYAEGQHRIKDPLIRYATKAKKATTTKEFTLYKIENHRKKEDISY